MVPLSPAAVQLIKEGLEASKEGWERKNDRPVFAGRFDGVTNLARHSLSHAVRRIVKDKKLAKFTPHDLRRTAATLAQSLRIPRDYVKALLNHSDGDVPPSMPAGTCPKRSWRPCWRSSRGCCR
jgi:integrase